MNYINYIQHAIYTPDILHRRFDFDMPDIRDTAKRVSLAALPFIGLYKPAGFALSVGMGGARVISHLQKLSSADQSGTWMQFGVELGGLSVGLLSLAATVYNYTTALFITTSVDLVHSAYLTGDALWNKQYAKAIEELAQTLSSVAYLGFMITGGLEAMVIHSLLQAATSLIQARAEFKLGKGHQIEAIGKLAMAFVRINQAKGYVAQIERRNALLEITKIRTLFEKIARAREASHLMNHPLSSLQERIEKGEVILNDGEISLGSHFHGFGCELVKGENLTFRTKMVDGKEIIEFDFKINHAFRGELEKSLNQIKSIQGKKLQEILELSGSHATGISVSNGSFFEKPFESWYDDDIGSAHKIKIEGLGTVLIGKASNIPNFYDKVVVQMEASQSVYNLHEILCLMNLDRALNLSTKDDIERLKLGHLFRNFFPREATPLERSKEYFELPIDELKAKMIKLAPEMQDVYANYFHKIREEHIFDGRVRYRIEGLADAAREAGARALTAAIMGAHTDSELFDRVISMLKGGMLATEVRKVNEFAKDGLGGGGVDFMSGGADSVYTQLLTKKHCDEEMKFSKLNYQSGVRFLISLNALEMGSYQYHRDSIGNRIVDEFDKFWWWGIESYKDRESILEFIRSQQMFPMHQNGHEVMLKERVAPSFFDGLVVSDQATKDKLLLRLKSEDLILDGLVLGKPIDKFIRVADRVTEELFV